MLTNSSVLTFLCKIINYITNISTVYVFLKTPVTQITLHVKYVQKFPDIYDNAAFNILLLLKYCFCIVVLQCKRLLSNKWCKLNFTNINHFELYNKKNTLSIM